MPLLWANKYIIDNHSFIQPRVNISLQQPQATDNHTFIHHHLRGGRAKDDVTFYMISGKTFKQFGFLMLVIS